MDAFKNAVLDALKANNGKLTHEQAVALIDPVSRHKFMNYLVPMRNEGLITLAVDRVDGKLQMFVLSPQTGGDA